MKRLSTILSSKQLLTNYKIFVRSHLDYVDIIYDKPFNDSFKEKLEKVQYFAALCNTLQHSILDEELGIESLSDRRW